MLRDSHYRDKLRHRARGIDDLERRVGDIVDHIEVRLRTQRVVSVLELGCGYGTALLELRDRFGDRVELHGVNRRDDDGNAAILRRNAGERGLLDRHPLESVALPAVAYADVAQGLPYADDYFDLVFSQVAWLYFGSKIAVIADVLRVLRDGGRANIDADESRADLPQEYSRLVEIWRDGTLVPFGDYLAKFGGAFIPAPEGYYLSIGKARGFGDDLEFVFELDVSTLHPHLDGIKCVYRLRDPAAHDWR